MGRRKGKLPFRVGGSWRDSIQESSREGGSMEDETLGSEARLPRLDSQLHSLPSVQLWAFCVSVSSFVN